MSLCLADLWFISIPLVLKDLSQSSQMCCKYQSMFEEGLLPYIPYLFVYATVVVSNVSSVRGRGFEIFVAFHASKIYKLHSFRFLIENHLFTIFTCITQNISIGFVIQCFMINKRILVFKGFETNFTSFTDCWLMLVSHVSTF